MTIQINDAPHEVDAGTSVQALVDGLELTEAAIAIAVNGSFVPRSTWAATSLQPADQVELVAPMAGG